VDPNGPQRVAAISIAEDRLALAVGRARSGGLERLDFIEETPSAGIRRGMISDAERFSDALDRLAGSLEKVSRATRLSRIICGVHGPFVEIQFLTRSFRFPRGVPIAEEDLQHALHETGRLEAAGRVLLQMMPWRFVLDGYRESDRPIGLRAEELGVEALGVYADQGPFQDFQEVFEELGLGGAELAMSSLATARHALTPEEQEGETVLLEFAWDECRLSLYGRSRLYLHECFRPGLSALADALSLEIPMTPPEARRLMRTLDLGDAEADRRAALARDFVEDVVGTARTRLAEGLAAMRASERSLLWVLTGLVSEASGVEPLVAALVGANVRVAAAAPSFRIGGFEDSLTCSLVGLLDCAASEPTYSQLGPARRAVERVKRFPARILGRVWGAGPSRGH
jgi:cell division ATPase FtsA